MTTSQRDEGCDEARDEEREQQWGDQWTGERRRRFAQWLHMIEAGELIPQPAEQPEAVVEASVADAPSASLPASAEDIEGAESGQPPAIPAALSMRRLLGMDSPLGRYGH